MSKVFKFQITSLIMMMSLLLGCNMQKQAEADEIHGDALIIDTHTDTPMIMVDGDFNLSERHEAPNSRVDIPRMKEGGVDAIFFALFTSQRERSAENYDEAYNLANRMLDSIKTASARFSDAIEIGASPEEILQIEGGGKTAICIGMENGFPLAMEIGRVREFYDKGVRYITLCHSSNNDICDSSTDRAGPEHNGLSDFGREVVAEMNRLGMIIDVSHISDKSFFDVLGLSTAPVIASHSSARAVCDHPRNMSDEMIMALAANGGVIQLCILGDYIADADTTSENYIKMEALRMKYNNWQYQDEEERRAVWREYDSINRHFPPVVPTVAQAVDHIDHIVALVGIDHVGIGSDFDGGGGLADCADVAGFPNITAELVKRGYSAEDIKKIWGGNFMRVFRACNELKE